VQLTTGINEQRAKHNLCVFAQS